jgi:ribonuclease BN (tRNA processing enzyme)
MTNDFVMKLTILGSGTSVPHPERASPAHWLETSNGTILLDIGPDAPHRMAQERLDWPSLDVIWISHFHLDHIGGLTPFLFGLKWAPQTQRRKKPLRIFGPRGLTHLIKAINESNNYRLFGQAFEVEIVEPETEFEILPGVVATSFDTPHTEESLALRLREQNLKSFVYTSDTGFSDNLAEFAMAADLLLMECSFRRNKPLHTHLQLDEAMRLAAHAAPAKLVLTHLYPDWDDVDLVAEARVLWPGETIAAFDGLRVEI